MAEQTAEPQADQTFAETPTNGDGGGGPDNVLLGHLQEMSSKIDQLIPQAPAGPSFGDLADPNFDPYADYEPQPGVYEGFDQPQFEYPQQPSYEQQAPGMSPEQAREWLQSEIQRGVQEAVNPIVAQQRALQLEAQFPDLKNPEVIQQIVPEAQRLAQSMNLGADGWRNPDFLAMVYQAQQARQTASQQIAPEDQQFDGQGYEGGGAGAPDAGDEPTVAERILAAYPHGDAHTFWGA